MAYQKSWIEKNMGISRKTLMQYEEHGFIKPARNSNNGKYREYSEEELEHIWHIKLFVKLGYSLKEIKDMLENPAFDFHKSISEKLEKLEEEKNQLEQLIGLAKFIKMTGIFPSVPKEMGSIKFEDFLKYSYESLNVDADPDSSMLYEMLNYDLPNLDAECDDEAMECLFEKIASKLEAEWSPEALCSILEQLRDIFNEPHMKSMMRLHSYREELASLSHYEVSHPDVQAAVKKMYDFEKNVLFYEHADLITPQWYAQHVPSYFTGSDLAIANEGILGKENCEFIVRAIEYFGSH